MIVQISQTDWERQRESLEWPSPYGDTLEGLRLGGTMDWQPIETAPEDGRLVLLWWPEWNMPVVGWFNGDWVLWHTPKAQVSPSSKIDPTHWLRLPDPPKESK